MLKETVYECELEDGNKAILTSKAVKQTPKIALSADEGKLITNGTFVGKGTIVDISEADSYYEIDDEDFDGSEDVSE